MFDSRASPDPCPAREVGSADILLQFSAGEGDLDLLCHPVAHKEGLGWQIAGQALELPAAGLGWIVVAESDAGKHPPLASATFAPAPPGSRDGETVALPNPPVKRGAHTYTFVIEDGWTKLPLSEVESNQAAFPSSNSAE